MGQQLLRFTLSRDRLHRRFPSLVTMPPPPLLGYNNNVRHRGRVFHIQTEDSGTNSPRIMTHLFADGGRIVRSTRTDYSEYLGRDDMVAVVKNMMKEQHKAMFVALRSGELDEIIGFEETEPATLSAAVIAPISDQFLREAQAAGQKAHAAITKADSEAGEPAEEKESEAPLEGVSIAVQPVVTFPGIKPYAPVRPASIFSVPPPNSASIFGEVGIDEKSLDDAILSYLAEDEDTARTKK